MEIAQQARRWYAERLASPHDARPWWDVVAITASSLRQAGHYEREIERRRMRGQIPPGVRYMVIPDPGERRAGSGGATIHAIRQIAPAGVAWWKTRRVLLLHCGGDSRRLPQYSLSGKLFSALPVRSSWGEATTVFDETLALSTAWAEATPGGLVVGSGDVVLRFDAGPLQWDRPGVCGVGMRQPAAKGMAHGVYVADDQGRVYSYLQKPTMSALQAAGALLDGGDVALDVGLLHFAPEVAAKLRAIELPEDAPAIDLYQHVTKALTGQWSPHPQDGAALHDLANALERIPFWCSMVEGEFIHVGTTTLLRELLTGAGRAPQAGGVVVDSVLDRRAQPGPGSLLIECHLSCPVEVARGSVVHALEGISSPVEVPEDTVVHQLPVVLPGGARGVVIRVYGVADDPKSSAAAWQATWFGRPMIQQLQSLGLDLSKVWPGLGPEHWTLWNAQLFPVCESPDEAWQWARWMMRLPCGRTSEQWGRQERLSLETSTRSADVAAVEASHNRRLQANWCAAAVALAGSGSDLRPMLAHSPGVAPLAETARRLRAEAADLEVQTPSEAASRCYQAGMFFDQAGLETDAVSAREAAFRMIGRAVRMGMDEEYAAPAPQRWARDTVAVSAPVRVDLGGGWSDTPPFCLDWGGTVFNAAIELNGACPIRTQVRRIEEPVIRCASPARGEMEVWRDTADLFRPARPGDPFLVARTALQMTGMFGDSDPLPTVLERIGGGLEICAAAQVPMGSGLGSSSILAATTVQALAAMSGEPFTDQELSHRVMRLEQLMTTGGGWQDQAGGIFPGAKLVSSGPGPRQSLRVQRVALDGRREEELQCLMVLYYTGIRRIARGLLQQVMGRYLARETAAVQVLHSIKTLAIEMWFATTEGDWDYLGKLLDRHWELNQLLDSNTTNAPINALLSLVRPYIRGAKLAGAGGGGCMMLLARSPEAAEELRSLLEARSRTQGGAVYQWTISRRGLRMESFG